ncbi:MAG: sulfatase family protein [Rubrobacteraceae bacterium]
MRRRAKCRWCRRARKRTAETPESSGSKRSQRGNVWTHAAALTALLAALAFGCGEEERGEIGERTGPEEARPNIVFVLADDFDPALLRAMPETRGGIRDRGVTLENAVISTPMCCPSRATILTGKYSHNHGVWYTRGIRGGWPAFQARGLDRDTVATRMHDAGYRTFFAGKYLNGYDDTRYVPPGWSVWNGYLGEYPGETYRLNEDGEIETYERDEVHDTDLIARKSEAFIRDTEKPFFAYIAPNATHSPYYAAERHASEFSGAGLPESLNRDEADVSDKPRYAREGPLLTEEQAAEEEDVHRQRLRAAASLDDLVGGALDALRSSGELDNTYVFFWTDNGYHLAGAHRLPRGKHTPYEEDIAVPMFVRGPGVPEGVAREGLASNTDLAPTFTVIAEATAPEEADGRSLLPLLGRNPPDRWRTALLIESRAGFREEPPEDMPAYAAMRTEDTTYVEYETGERELYDLVRDPRQLHNLARAAEPEQLSVMSGRLAALRSCAAEECREAED